jgi:hypothetical protein
MVKAIFVSICPGGVDVGGKGVGVADWQATKTTDRMNHVDRIFVNIVYPFEILKPGFCGEDCSSPLIRFWQELVAPD